MEPRIAFNTAVSFVTNTNRSTIRILLPLAFLFAIVLIAFGVVQSWWSGVDVTNPDGCGSLRSCMDPGDGSEIPTRVPGLP